MACTNDQDDGIAFLNWGLIVRADSIESGDPFTATLGGIAVFDEIFLDEAQFALPDGVDEVNLVEFNATVHVHSGATGDEVVLKPEPIASECLRGGSPCDPENDLPSVPGLVGNTDCEPVAKSNPCGRFYILPTSTDCFPEGICANRRKESQCDRNGFCITGDLEIQLQEKTGHYTADAQGDVLFGWDDESTGATVQQGGDNDGTWILPEAVYEESTGPNGFRVTVVSRHAAASLPVALECTMGVPSRGPPCNSLDFLSCPTPESELISFPIQAEAF